MCVNITYQGTRGVMMMMMISRKACGRAVARLIERCKLFYFIFFLFFEILVQYVYPASVPKKEEANDVD